MTLPNIFYCLRIKYSCIQKWKVECSYINRILMFEFFKSHLVIHYRTSLPVLSPTPTFQVLTLLYPHLFSICLPFPWLPQTPHESTSLSPKWSHGLLQPTQTCPSHGSLMLPTNKDLAEDYLWLLFSL